MKTKIQKRIKEESLIITKKIEQVQVKTGELSDQVGNAMVNQRKLAEKLEKQISVLKQNVEQSVANVLHFDNKFRDQLMTKLNQEDFIQLKTELSQYALKIEVSEIQNKIIPETMRSISQVTEQIDQLRMDSFNLKRGFDKIDYDLLLKASKIDLDEIRTLSQSKLNQVRFVQEMQTIDRKISNISLEMDSFVKNQTLQFKDLANKFLFEYNKNFQSWIEENVTSKFKNLAEGLLL